MTLQLAEEQLILELRKIYDQRESAAIADLVMEKLSGWRKIDRIIHKSNLLSSEQELHMIQYKEKLMIYEPVQYVLQEAWFSGLKFYVDESVLIPRPETEELVEWTIDILRQRGEPFNHILDVGTGSGCIAIALKKKLPNAHISSCDISLSALNVARKNAETHHTSVDFLLIDFLEKSEWSNLPSVDCIISNPPYIPSGDLETLEPNVALFEPHLALFVPSEDPLLFYKVLADFGRTKLAPGGILIAELHESFSVDAIHELESKGYSSVTLKKDHQGKQRMIKATWLP